MCVFLPLFRMENHKNQGSQHVDGKFLGSAKSSDTPLTGPKPKLAWEKGGRGARPIILVPMRCPNNFFSFTPGNKFESLFLKLLALSFAVMLRQSVSTTSSQNYFPKLFSNLTKSYPLLSYHVVLLVSLGPSKIFLFAGTQLYFGTEKEGNIGRAGMHIM